MFENNLHVTCSMQIKKSKTCVEPKSRIGFGYILVSVKTNEIGKLGECASSAACFKGSE